MSCATCHLDGGHDGRVWDFTGRGEGLRNTATLHGRGGTAHGNVHWTANFDEIQDFENDMRGAFGGSGFLSDARLRRDAARRSARRRPGARPSSTRWPPTSPRSTPARCRAARGATPTAR